MESEEEIKNENIRCGIQQSLREPRSGSGKDSSGK
jgi:hypothetical protein